MRADIIYKTTNAATILARKHDQREMHLAETLSLNSVLMEVLLIREKERISLGLICSRWNRTLKLFVRSLLSNSFAKHGTDPKQIS